MPSEPRFVFDTNVVVSALLIREPVARKAFDVALEKGSILISRETVLELHEVLQREAFRRYVSDEERAEFLAAFVREGLFDRDYVIQLVEDHRNNRDDNHVRIWMLLNMEVWHQLYIEQLDIETVTERLRQASALHS